VTCTILGLVRILGTGGAAIPSSTPAAPPLPLPLATTLCTFLHALPVTPPTPPTSPLPLLALPDLPQSLSTLPSPLPSPLPRLGPLPLCCPATPLYRTTAVLLPPPQRQQHQPQEQEEEDCYSGPPLLALAPGGPWSRPGTPHRQAPTLPPVPRPWHAAVLDPCCASNAGGVPEADAPSRCCLGTPNAHSGACADGWDAAGAPRHCAA